MARLTCDNAVSLELLCFSKRVDEIWGDVVDAYIAISDGEEWFDVNLSWSGDDAEEHAQEALDVLQVSLEKRGRTQWQLDAAREKVAT